MNLKWQKDESCEYYNYKRKDIDENKQYFYNNTHNH